MFSPMETAVVFVVGLLYLIPLAAFCKIVQRLGWPWAMGLLMLVPLLNVVMICVFAWSNPPARSKPPQ